MHHSRKSLKNAKPPILEVPGHSKSSMLIPLKSSSPVLVMISSMFMRQYRQNNHFLERCSSLTLTCASLIKFRGSGFRLRKSTFDAEISCADCLGLFLAISAQFTHKMCVATRDREKFTKTPYFGGLRSFKVMELDISKKLVSCNGPCYICNRFHAEGADSEKMRTF